MGVIRRQSIKYSVVNLTGLAIGTFSTLFIYPHVLEANGTLRFLLDTGMVFFPLLALGANILTNRFFPTFQNRTAENHGFLPLMLSVTGVGLSLFWLFMCMFWRKIEHYYFHQSPQLAAYLHFILPVASFYVINQVLYNYAANFKRIVVPTILIDFSQKIVLPLLLLAVWQGWITLFWACWGLVIHGFAVTVGLILYLKKIGAWLWGNFLPFLTPELSRDMLRYAAFGTFGGLALLVASKIDTLMVGSLVDARSLGIFAIALQMAGVIEVPTKGMYSASISSLTRHLHDENYAELGKLYQNVSIHLLLAGLLLFFGIWLAHEPLCRLLPRGEVIAAGRWVFFFIGLSRLIEMCTGLNNNIVYYSKYYFWSLVSLATTATLTIFLNLWWIPRWGIVGAALATCCAVLFYNACTLVVVWLKFGLQPFTHKTLLATGAAILIYVLISQLPSTHSEVGDILLRSGGFCFVFLWVMVRLNISEEFNQLVSKIIKAGIHQK